MGSKPKGYTLDPLVAQALQQKLQSETGNGNRYASANKTRGRKVTRPFKVYTDDIPTSSERRSFLRRHKLDEMFTTNDGSGTIPNPKMRRKSAAAMSSTILESAQKQSNQQEVKHSIKVEEYRSPVPTAPARAAEIERGPVKDSAYFERRKKNNEAAKKSRDRRRIKEDENFIRATILEHENIALKVELEATKRQLAQYMLI